MRKVLELSPWVGHILPGGLPQAQGWLAAPFLVAPDGCHPLASTSDAMQDQLSWQPPTTP